MRRAAAKAVGAVLVGAVLVGGGWVLARQMVSPEQAAARAEAPPPAPVVASLREGYLRGAVTMSVTAQPSGTRDVVAPSPLTGVVTASDLAPGASVTAGTALVRVNGRPIIVLTGAFPLYRDLVAGDSGDDVRMLQEALIDAGLMTGTVDGVLGSRTLAAVRALYEEVGFTAPTTVVEAPPVVAAAQPSADGVSAEGAAAPPTPPRPQTSVSAAELVFTPELPATATSFAAVGAVIDPGTTVASLATGSTQLVADLPPEAIGPLAVGATGTFTDPDGQDGSAALASITPGADGQARVLWTPTGAVTPGTTYVLSIENPAAQAEPMLLAPTSALVSRGGADTVLVRDGDVFREVPVEVVGTEGGVSAIRPVGEDPALRAGAEVRLA